MELLKNQHKISQKDNGPLQRLLFFLNISLLLIATIMIIFSLVQSTLAWIAYMDWKLGFIAKLPLILGCFLSRDKNYWTPTRA